MADLKGTKTHQHLKDAFAGESQANRRYLYFANKADIEGQPEVASLFRATAEGETGHAHGHLDYLAQVGDPATDLPIGNSSDNLKSAVAGETHDGHAFVNDVIDRGIDGVGADFGGLPEYFPHLDGALSTSGSPQAPGADRPTSHPMAELGAAYSLDGWRAATWRDTEMAQRRVGHCVQ